MKKYLQLIAAALLVTSCSQQELSVPSQTGAIDFQASIGTYSVRATDTSFENGDEVTICAESPINSGAVKYTYSNGQLTSSTPICWLSGQTQQTGFALYYPYDPNINPNLTTYEFTVNADQSTHQSYTASDLMSGYAVANPGSSVRFQVSHQNSKIHIYIDNRSEYTIQDVYLANIYGKCEYGENGNRVIGTPGTIKACPIYENSQKSWIMILPPQNSKPDLIVTTTNGKQLTYTLPSNFNFKSGYQANAYVTLSEENTFTDFTADIINWLPDNNLQFSNGADMTGWNYMGKGKWMDDILATYFGLGHMEMDVDIYVDANNPARFKIQDPYKNWPYLSLWGDYFTYHEGASIIINNTSGISYIEQGSSTGISCKYSDNNQVCNFYSPCHENGWYNISCYGYQNYSGCWRFFDVLIMTVGENTSYVNNSDMTIFTLPGYTRWPYFNILGNIYYDNQYKNFTYGSSRDASKLGISIFPGRDVTQEDLEKTNNGTHPHQFLYDDNYLMADQRIGYAMPSLSTGIYTILVAAAGTYLNGEDLSNFDYLTIGYVAEGESAPACNPHIVNIQVDPTSSSIILNVKAQDIKWARYLAYPTATLNSMGMSFDEIAATAYDNGTSIRGTISNFESEEGQTVQINGLEPDTEYTIFVVVGNLYEQTGYAYATATSPAQNEFVSLGYGTYIDQLIPIFVEDSTMTDYYYANVEIQQEKSGKPIYRIIKPYEDLFRYRKSGKWYDEYIPNGLECEYIEFYVKSFDSGNYIFYQPFHCGVSDCYFTQEGDPLIYKHNSGDIYQNPEGYAATAYNKQIAQGIFEMAPAVYISNTGYFYGYYNDEEAIIICLPGYNYTPKMNAPARGNIPGPVRINKAERTRTKYYE